MLSRNQLGFLYMFLSVFAFSMMDLLVKWSDNYPVGEVLFFRGICGLIPISVSYTHLTLPTNREV